ncbi:MAG: hypothetical protein KUG82_09625 [Pseudomonadales bacterium]|nr:hypothetical protein [Pseudomonadales bacterium]
MGIMVIYLLIYLFFSTISIVAAIVVHRNSVKSGFSDKAMLMYKVLGFIIAIILTWILILLVPTIIDVTRNTAFDKKFIHGVIQLALTLITPISIVLVAHLLFVDRKREKYISVGALFSMPIIPWVTYFPFVYLIYRG